MRINYFTGLSYEAGKYVIIIIINAMKQFRPVNLLDVRDQCIFVEFVENWVNGQKKKKKKKEKEKQYQYFCCVKHSQESLSIYYLSLDPKMNKTCCPEPFES